MRKIFALLLCCTICFSNMGILANTVYAAESEEADLADVSSNGEVQTVAEHKPNSLEIVYVSGTGKPDASGADANNPINDLNLALSMVQDKGAIEVIGDITVTNVQFPTKTVVLRGNVKSDSARTRITFVGEVAFNMVTYFNDLDLEFKDRVFINGNMITMKDSVILGYPDIYLGAKDADIEYGTNGSLTMSNSSVLPNQIGNIYLGGYNNHTVDASSISLRNVMFDGRIDGAQVAERCNLTFSGDVTIPVIENAYKIILDDKANLRITDHIRNVRELYGEKAKLTLDERSILEIEYLYGDMGIDFNEPIVQRDFIICKNIVGDLFLSDALIRDGYRINKVRSGNDIKIALLNPLSGDMQTNYAPSIKHPKDMVAWEGKAVDLRQGVSAWDFEDGDLTDQIVFPDVDVSQLPVGDHEIVYQVTDKHGNVTKSTRMVHVLGNAYPIIEGVKDIELKLKDVDAFDSLDGITVKDDKDANITIQVEGQISKPAAGTEETFILTYRAQDSDNHVTTVTRKIHITNFVPQIQGLSDVEIYRDDQFDFMNGVTASDPEDGEQVNITIENPVDVSQPGHFEVIYTATDSDSNTTQAVRNVIVKDWVDWTDIQPSKPTPPPTPEPTEPQPTEPKPTEPVTYTVSFHSNGGSQIAAVSAVAGTTVDLSAYAPTKSGYVFAGWYGDAELTKQVTSVNLTGNLTVYAKWTKKIVENPFTDVSSNQYYYDSVLWAVSNQITAGVTPTTFGPNQSCTRAQTVTFLWSAAGKPKPKMTKNPFTDVKQSDYFYDAVLWAFENRITQGISSDKFGPSQTCTRAQAVTFLWSAAGRPMVSNESTFNDVNPSAYYYNAVRWANENKITAGVGGGKFGPSQVCTRAQIITFLYKAYN